MSKYWMRTVKFIIEDLEIEMPGIDIDFSIEFSDESDGNIGNIKFYNLKDTTVDKLKKDTQFILKAGYKGYNGVVLPGIIKKAVTNWEKSDKITTLIVGDNTESWLTTTVNKTWKSGTKASQIVPELVSNTSLSAGEIDLVEDVIYEKGVTFSTTNRKALEEIAADTGSKLHSSRGKVYIRPNSISNRRAILLNSDTGLISSPEKVEEEDAVKYTVLSLFNYKIQTDSLIKIESRTVDGYFRVIEGEHTCKGDNYQTKVEVEKVEGNQ